MRTPYTSGVMLLGCAALAACSPKEPPPAAALPATTTTAVVAAQPCPPESPVKIDNVSVAAGAASASISINPEPRQISKNAGGVRWTLKSPSGKTYVFAADGIVFKNNPPPGPASAPATGKADEFVWCFNPTPNSSTWSYSVKFYDQDTPGTVWVCDPTIVNDATAVADAATPVNCVKQP